MAYVDMLQKYFDRGFSSWHIKCQLGDIVNTGAKKAISADFETNVCDLDSNKAVSILWSLKIDNDQMDETRWIGLSCLSTTIPIPISWRMVMYEEGKGVVFNYSGMQLFDDRHPTAWICFETLEDIELLKRAKLSLHVFVAVPLTVVESALANNENTNGILHEKMTDEILDGFSKLLRKVLGERIDDYDMGQPIEEKTESEEDEEEEDSDITLAIVDKENGSDCLVDKEHRSECQFKCHRTILMAHSLFFRRLIRRRRTTSRADLIDFVSEEVSPIVKIDDVDGDTMAAVLQYIYCGILPVFIDDTENGKYEAALKLAYAAAKFELPKLLDYCVAVLIFRYADDAKRVDQLAIGETVKDNRWNAVCKQQLATYVLSTGDQTLISPLSKESQCEILKMAQNLVLSSNCVYLKIGPSSEK